MRRDDLYATLDQLERLGLGALRERWTALELGPVPSSRSPDLLRRLIGWELQCRIYGGLDAETRRLVKSSQRKRTSSLQPGQRLVREWQGRPIEVLATEDGFEFQGERFRSLSAIATQVTGVRWNGPRFFGLTEKANAHG